MGNIAHSLGKAAGLDVTTLWRDMMIGNAYTWPKEKPEWCVMIPVRALWSYEEDRYGRGPNALASLAGARLQQYQDKIMIQVANSMAIPAHLMSPGTIATVGSDGKARPTLKGEEPHMIITDEVGETDVKHNP